MNWDLSRIYNGLNDPAMERDMCLASQAIEDASKRVEELDKGDLTENLHAVVELLCRATDIVQMLGSMVGFVLAANASCTEALTPRNRVEELDNRLSLAMSALARKIGNDPRIDDCIAKDSLLAAHALFFRNLREQAKHLMDPAIEPVVLEMQRSGGKAWMRLRDELFAGLTIDVCMDGECRRLPLTAVRAMAYDAREEVRESGYKAELGAYPRMETGMAACLNGIKGDANTVSKLRGFDSVLENSLASSRMQRATLDALLQALREAMPMFRKYFRVKNRLLGHDGALRFYNLFAPLGSDNRLYTLDEARDMLLRVFSESHMPIAEVMRRAFDERLIDAYPREGKEGGAFCNGVHAIKRSSVLTNFDGSFGSVSTLAHELGHAYQDSLLADVSVLLTDLPMPLAETASTFNEFLLAEHIMRDADEAQTIALLDQQIGDAAQVIVDIMSRFLFESEVVERRKDGLLSADELCDIMRRAQLETYGDGLDPEYLHPYMWACKSHYYDVDYHFYNFPYAFGQLFAAGLYQKYAREGAAFWHMYDEMLRASGVETVENAALRADIDVTDINFWRDALAIYERKIERLTAFAENK